MTTLDKETLAYDALDLADRLIERGYGTDKPAEWDAAYRAVAEARASHRKAETADQSTGAETALLPCPMCGDATAPARDTVFDHRLPHRVYCRGCGVATPYRTTMALAVEQWNRRALASPAAETVRERFYDALPDTAGKRGQWTGAEIEAALDAALASEGPAQQSAPSKAETATAPTSAEVDRRVEEWHQGKWSGALRDALGWTEAEYSAWVSDPNAIPARPLPSKTTPAPADVVERMCKAYAEATGYYVEFHSGLSSESADKMRKGMTAALAAMQTAPVPDELRQLRAKAAEGPWFVAGRATDDGLAVIEDGRSDGMFPIKAEWHEAEFIAALVNWFDAYMARLDTSRAQTGEA